MAHIQGSYREISGHETHIRGILSMISYFNSSNFKYLLGILTSNTRNTYFNIYGYLSMFYKLICICYQFFFFNHWKKFSNLLTTLNFHYYCEVGTEVGKRRAIKKTTHQHIVIPERRWMFTIAIETKRKNAEKCRNKFGIC